MTGRMRRGGGFDSCAGHQLTMSADTKKGRGDGERLSLSSRRSKDGDPAAVLFKEITITEMYYYSYDTIPKETRAKFTESDDRLVRKAYRAAYPEDIPIHRAQTPEAAAVLDGISGHLYHVREGFE